VALLVDVVRPDVRVITNVGPAHLDVAGSVAGVARQKAPMFATAQAGDVCVGSTDDAAVAAMVRPAGVRREDVGASSRFRLLSVAPVDDLAVHARWATPEGEVEARLSTPAPHMAQNATFALAVAHVCGVSMAAAVQALERFRPMAGRLRPLRTHDGVRVIDDAFNANPVSMASALRVLGSLPGPRRAVLGDMLALGREEAAHHEALLALAKRVGLEQLIVVGEAFGRAARSSDSVCCVPSPDRAVEALRSELRPGDVVLVKGSHAVGLGAVIAALVPESQR
ncbi:MAG: hypothetical protein KTR31_09870, partial [Myxococcales bacterium]|nr:hypothetical protein [Myxococcales bacterium]